MKREEKKSFVDFSKSEEGKRIFEANKAIWKNGNFFEHIKSLTNPQEIEMAQIMRRYQSSFSWVNKGVEHLKAFQIRHTPTVKPEDLGSDLDITEGYLWLEIIVPEKFPNEPASFVLLNHSLSRDFKRWFEKDLFDFGIECKSLLRTIKYMDNQLDKICKQIQNKIARGVPFEVVKPVEKEAPAKETKTEKDAPAWSQEQQVLLEKAIVKHKDIKDAKEKWQKIAQDVGKTMAECVQRFKDCKKSAEEKKEKKEVEEHKTNPQTGTHENGDEEDEEDEDGDEEDDSEGTSEDSLEEQKEEQKVNRKIRDYQEYETCIDSIVVAKSLRFENVSVGSLISIQSQVSCKSCQGIHEVEAIKEADSEYILNNDKCPKCGLKSRLVAKQEIFHETANVICSIGSFTWDIRDLHFCEFDLTCEFCDTANRTKKILAGQPVYMECKGCYKKMQFSFMALTLNSLAGADDTDGAKDGNATNVQDIMKRIFAKKNKFEFKVGFPLPNYGACKHYKHSNRYFRFPCCGKTYPCDDCHDKVEKHEMEERAKNMICGYCSSEQPIADTCKRCAKAVTKIYRHTGYWEGGKGTRNIATMSKKDPHKFAGIGKTVSSKKRNTAKNKQKASN